MRKIRKGDHVVLLSGRDRGKRGTVTAVSDGQVTVEGLNMVTRHTKGNPNANKPGGRVAKAMPMPLSKVALWNAVAKKADRVGIRKLADGKRVRFFKSNGEVIDA